MDFHISKSVAVLIGLALLVGGGIGGAIVFMAGSEEGHGDNNEMSDRSYGYDTRAGGETIDGMGGSPNQDGERAVENRASVTVKPSAAISTTSLKTQN